MNQFKNLTLSEIIAAEEALYREKESRKRQIKETKWYSDLKTEYLELIKDKEIKLNGEYFVNIRQAFVINLAFDFESRDVQVSITVDDHDRQMEQYRNKYFEKLTEFKAKASEIIKQNDFNIDFVLEMISDENRSW